MADRMTYSEQIHIYTQRLIKALTDLSMTLEHYTVGNNRFVLPVSCYDFPEIRRLALAMGFKQMLATPRPTASPLPLEPVRPSLFPDQNSIDRKTP